MGHVIFYRQFIKEFSKFSKPLIGLLIKDVEFNFDKHCLESFQKLKETVIFIPRMQPPNLSILFKTMWDANDHVIGAVLRKIRDKKMHAIYYMRITLYKAQINYATMENSFYS